MSVKGGHTQTIAKALAAQLGVYKVFLYSCMRNVTPHEFNCGSDLSFEIKALINMLGGGEFKEGV